LVLAVLERRTAAFPGLGDVYASVVGGMSVVEPAADLALALAVASAATGVPVPPDLVAFGEIGLGGEIRQVPDAGRRLAEAARVGFRRAVVPAFCPDGPDELRLIRVHTLDQSVSSILVAGQAA
jgi:DNA repair protein RadA/Sms